MRRLVPALLFSMLAACSAPASIAGRVTPQPKPAPEPVCDTAALAARGDLDGVLRLIEGCPDPSPATQIERVEALVTLGEIGEAKRFAAQIVEIGRRRASASADAFVQRATEIVRLDEPPRPTRAQATAEAEALVARSRDERGPQRVIDLAKAKHALERAIGEKATRVLFERGDSGSWVGDRVLAELRVHDLPLNGTSPLDADVVFEVDAATHTLRPTALFAPAADLTVSPVVELPSSGFAVQTAGGARVRFTGHDPPDLLRAPGVLSVSPKGDVLVGTGGDRVAAFEVGTWTERFSIAAPIKHQPLYSGDLLVGLGDNEPNVVVDLQRGEAILNEMGTGALSPSGRSLVVMSAAPESTSDAQKWSIAIYALPSMKKRVLTLSENMYGGPILAFDGEDRVLVTQLVSTYRECIINTFAIVDVAQGRLVPVPRDRPDPHCVNSLVYGPTRSGLSAEADAALTPLELVVRRGGKDIHRVPLAMKDGFSPNAILGTPDDRFLLACGYGAAASGSFLLDVTTGATTFVPAASNCNALSMRGSVLFTPSGLVDLGSDQSLPSWPTTVLLPSIHARQLTELQKSGSVPADTPGLFCRIGDVIQPYDVCGPP